MKHKRSTALLLALLMMASVFSSATSVFAESKIEAPRVNQLVKKVEKVKVEEKKEDPEEVKAAEDELEIGGEEVPGAVGEPQQYDISKINTIAKVVKDGKTKYYGVKTYGNQSDHAGGTKQFYEITEDVYNTVKEDCFMRFTRVDISKDASGNEQKVELPFKLDRVSLGGDINDPSALTTPEQGAVFTEIYFRHHMAYREGFVNMAPYNLPEQKYYTYNLELQRDWTIEQIDGFYRGEKDNWADINFNCILEGNGHTLSKSANTPADDDEVTLMKINIGQDAGAVDYPSRKVAIRNLTIDGSVNETPKYACMVVFDKTDLTLENVKLTNGKNGKPEKYESGGLTLYNDIKLTMDEKSEISNCTSQYGGALRVRGKSTLNINGSKFSKNSAEVGGAIAVIDDESTVNIKDATFENNSSTGQAGAIYSNSSMTIDNTTFKNNSAAQQGGAIYQTKERDSNIKKSKFEENASTLDGGAIYVSWKAKAEISETSFNKNVSEKNGGAISFEYDNVNESTVSKCNFEENRSPSGGGIYLGKKSKLKVDESDFEKNQSNDGGAIYTNPYEYADPISKAEAYKNLKVDDKTLFKGNVANAGLFSPPRNYEEFTNLKFNSNSDVDHGVLSRRSLLNNYDVNYKNPNKLIIYDANGGKFADGKEIKTELHKENEEIKLMEAPTREGYKFLYWSSKGFDPGDAYKVSGNQNFVAQWEKVEPKKPDKPTPGGGFYFVPTDTPLLNRKDHAQYMIGYPDQSFKPDNHMSRQEVTVMFSRLLNERPQKGVIYSRDYKDIPDDLWSVTAISYMSKLGMVKGYPDGNFMPRTAITRAEFAAMATRFADLSAGSKTFTDVAKDHWAYDVIQKAAGAGWISGYPDGSFKPDQPITRAEVVAITNRMLNRFADEAYVDAHRDKILQFKDMKKGMWSYYPVVEATNGHGYERKTNGKDETWFEVNGTTFVYDK